MVSEVCKYLLELGSKQGVAFVGECGNGPNVVFVPHGPVVRHVATVIDLAEVLGRECNVDVSSRMLKAVEVGLLTNTIHSWAPQTTERIDDINAEITCLFYLSNMCACIEHGHLQ